MASSKNVLPLIPSYRVNTTRWYIRQDYKSNWVEIFSK